MKSKLVAILTVAMLFLGTFVALPIVYAVPPTISMTPSNNIYTTDTATAGTKFNVTISCSDVPDIGGAQIYLEFNDSIINVTRWWAPDWDANFFMPTPYSALPTPPNDAGYMHLGAGIGRVQVSVLKGGLPPVAPWGHAGKICMFEFNITAIPPKYGELSTTLKINSTNTYLLDPASIEIPDVVKNNGLYDISWAQPASPNMGLNPLTKTFGPDPPSAIGQAFNVELLIKNLSPAWYLTQASFNFTYNATIIDVVGGTANITVNALWATSTKTYTAGLITINVSDPTSNPSGSVLVATIKFTVMMQQNIPPAPMGTYDQSPLTFSNVTFYDHIAAITPGTSESGYVRVNALRTLALPWLEIVPTLVEIGPEPSIGEQFTVGVKLTGPPPNYLDQSWYLIGVQFRLFYDPTLIAAVGVVEGPFLQNPSWNLYGTIFVGTLEANGLGPHVLVGGMLLPNGTGYWNQTVFPNGQGIVAYITFEVLKQECPDPFESNLTLLGVFDGFEEFGINREGEYIPFDDPVNGLVRILPFDMPGRVIDLYGGANNDGYWSGYPDPFPAPYGGQGLNHWMDLVFPQSEVTLYVNLTYNYWPVQSKDVGFEIEGPYEKLQNGTLVPKQRYQIWAKFTRTSDSEGVATLTYRMPWPCEDPDGITGIWLITATATIGDVVITDTMIFYYERAVYITSVVTDSFYYTHGEFVKVTVCYRTHAVQTYPGLFAIVLTDDLGVPFGMALEGVTIGGATFCTWKVNCFTVSIFIPKWAYAGYGEVHVNVFDKDPTVGGFAYHPEFAPAPEFQIGPY